ncbi:hypothetical protein MBLNU230_g2852t2 [Neophaeotheca triangularis]
MPDTDPGEQIVLNKSQAPKSNAPNLRSSSRRTSSTQSSSRSHKHSPSPSRGSKTPLTPEESPPFTQTRKRDASIVALEDKEIESIGTPAHRTGDGEESTAQVCICQPDPKIPRPRNAFILYRQHHQASVVAQYPSLANPEISKIIGEQWRNQSAEVKNEWKALAEEEKLRHQQQYPSYRYQPKRNGRRNSVTSDSPITANGEKPKCARCGGRSLLALSTPFTANSSRSSPTNVQPRTPHTAGITPVSRTLPVLRDLSIQSPAAARSTRQFPANAMSPMYSPHVDERDELGPLSPDLKRRRFNVEHQGVMQRTMPQRYTHAMAQGSPGGPGTPFPFGAPPPPHPYPPAVSRRESLPGLRGVVSPPGPMATPPRPGMGYSQHRLSQGHMAHDRSLILPPLQTNSTPTATSQTPTTAAPPNTSSRNSSKTIEEIIAGIAFNYKIKVLGRIAPPAPLRKETPRGPLIAVEGDNPVAVKALSKWLVKTLSKEEQKGVVEYQGPAMPQNVSSNNAMATYHRLAADWLDKQAELVEALASGCKPIVQSGATAAAPQSANRHISEDYDDSDASSSPKVSANNMSSHNTTATRCHSTDKMDVDAAPSPSGPNSTTSPLSDPCVVIIPNFSLHASNTFATLIPIKDPYSPSDHWQWTATQWRGIVGPDLTIFLKDNGETGTKQSVEILEEEKNVVVKRAATKDTDSDTGVDGSVLRRLGFEIGEWVRGFGVGNGVAEERRG